MSKKLKYKLKLKEVLKDNGLSQQGLMFLIEKKTGEKINKNTISELSTGKRVDCMVHTVALICKTLNLKPNDLIEIM